MKGTTAHLCGDQFIKLAVAHARGNNLIDVALIALLEDLGLSDIDLADRIFHLASDDQEL